jgi:hypothetical protein
VIVVKEVKFSVTVDEHDYQTKKNQAVRFLTEGDKVKASLRFRGRQMAHRELGYAIINRLIQDIGDAGIVEFMPRMEGTILHAILAPAKKQEAPKPKPPAAPALRPFGPAGTIKIWSWSEPELKLSKAALSWAAFELSRVRQAGFHALAPHRSARFCFAKTLERRPCNPNAPFRTGNPLRSWPVEGDFVENFLPS